MPTSPTRPCLLLALLLNLVAVAAGTRKTLSPCKQCHVYAAKATKALAKKDAWDKYVVA